jgi:hypothetical protein
MESSIEIYVSSIIEFLNVSKNKCDGGEPVIGLSDYPDITSVEDRKPFFISKNGKNEYRLMPGDMELDTSSLRGLLSEIIESSSSVGIGKYVFFIITRIDPTKIVNGLDGENGRLFTTVDVWKFPKDQLSSANEPPTTKDVHIGLPPPPTKEEAPLEKVQVKPVQPVYSSVEPKPTPIQANILNQTTPIPENYHPLPLPHPKYQPSPSVGPVQQAYYPPTVVQNPSMGSVDVEDLEMIELFGKKIKKTNLVLVIGGILIGSAIAYYFVCKKKTKNSKRIISDETDEESNIEKMAKYYKDAYGNKKTKIPTKYKKGKHGSTKSSKSRKSKPKR